MSEGNMSLKHFGVVPQVLILWLVSLESAAIAASVMIWKKGIVLELRTATRGMSEDIVEYKSVFAEAHQQG